MMGRLDRLVAEKRAHIADLRKIWSTRPLDLDEYRALQKLEMQIAAWDGGRTEGITRMFFEEYEGRKA